MKRLLGILMMSLIIKYISLLSKNGFNKNIISIENVLLMGDRKVAKTKRTPIKRRRTKAWYDVQAYSVN